MPFIHIASSIPMLISVKVSSRVNFKYLLSCQFQNFYNHVNFKLLQSCKFQDSCSHVSQFQFVFAIPSVSVIGQVASSHPRTTCACQFTLVIGQVASSHPRTACACQFTLVIGQVASSHPRTTCACQSTPVIGQVASSHPRTTCTCQFAFILVIGQAASSNTRTACTCALFLPSAKRLVRIQEQLVPVYFVVSLGQVPGSNQKNNLHLSICYFSLPSESCYLLSC